MSKTLKDLPAVSTRMHASKATIVPVRPTPKSRKNKDNRFKILKSDSKLAKKKNKKIYIIEVYS